MTSCRASWPWPLPRNWPPSWERSFGLCFLRASFIVLLCQSAFGLTPPSVEKYDDFFWSWGGPEHSLDIWMSIEILYLLRSYKTRYWSLQVQNLITGSHPHNHRPDCQNATRRPSETEVSQIPIYIGLVFRLGSTSKPLPIVRELCKWQIRHSWDS